MFSFETMRCARLSRALLAALALAGCAEPSAGDGVSDLDPGYPGADGGVEEGDLGVATESLTGAVRYSGQCSPFMMATSERAAFYARVMASSSAFRSCVANTMREHYWDCDIDPIHSSSLESQVGRAMELLGEFDNDLRILCNPDAPNPSASYQGHATHDEHSMTFDSGFHEQNGDWITRYGITAESHVNEPWNFLAGTVLHELAHTHDYGHLALDCAATDGGHIDVANGVTACTVPECTWTRGCGGSGTPPPSMTVASAGAAERNVCSYRTVGRDDRYPTTYGRLDPSLPYILSACAGAFLEESADQCGQASRGCGDGELNLLAGWTGSVGDGFSYPTQPRGCTCVQDPRHLVAARTAGSSYLTASGGGSSLTTREATTRGAWQTFYVHDLNGGEWLSGDQVRVKSWDGHWLQGGFLATATTPPTYPYVFDERLGRPLGTYSIVRMMTRARAPLTTRVETRWAFDDDASIVARTTSGWTDPHTIMLEEYRRDRALYLGRAGTDFFVDVSPVSRRVFGGGQGSVLRGTATGLAATKRNSGFWLIDHDAGELEDGDSISLETLVGDGWHYLSTRAVPGGQLALHHSIGAEERFRVHRLAGAGRVVDGDVVTLRAAGGRYLEFVGSGRAAQLRSSATSESASTRIVLWDVDQLDVVRPTWR